MVQRSALPALSALAAACFLLAGTPVQAQAQAQEATIARAPIARVTLYAGVASVERTARITAATRQLVFECLPGSIDPQSLQVSADAGVRLGGVNVMEIKNHLNISSDFFVVREDTYQQKKDVLKRFLHAYQDSAKWMMQSPEEAAKLAVKYAIDGQNTSMNLDIIRLRNESSVSAITEQRGLGAFDMAGLQKGANAYKAFGVIQRDIRISDVVSQDLLPTFTLGAKTTTRTTTKK